MIKHFNYIFIIYSILIMLAAGSSFILTSCSSETFTQQGSELKKGEQTLTFTEKKNGIDVHYEVHFKDGKISSIYKDNVKLPEDEIDNYKKLIYSKLNSLTQNEEDFIFIHKPHVFYFDTDSFNDKMDTLRETFKGEHFNFKFDNENFKDGIKKLKEELKSRDEIVIKIERDKIGEHLDKAKKHLSELKLHKFDFDFDEDELHKNMKRITIELKDAEKEINLNMENLKKEMERLNEEMSDLSEGMENLDKEMKNLSNFIDAVKQELLIDGYIKNIEEEFEFELTSKETKVNGERVTDSLHPKYKELYKLHFNKEIKEKVKFHIE